MILTFLPFLAPIWESVIFVATTSYVLSCTNFIRIVLSTLHTNIPCQLLRSSLPFFLCKIVIFAVLRQSGTVTSVFILFIIIRIDSFRSFPIAPSLNSSQMQLLGSLLLPFLRFLRTLYLVNKTLQESPNAAQRTSRRLSRCQKVLNKGLF